MTDLFQFASIPATSKNGQGTPQLGRRHRHSVKDGRYQSTISTAGLRVSDSRIIARLLLGGDPYAWRKAIGKENALQIRSPGSAAKIAGLLRARLVLMSPAIWAMISEGPRTLATHACLAAAIKHSRLLGDYMDLVVREKYRAFAPTLAHTDWECFVEECRGRDPTMGDWSDSTIQRLRVVVHRILATAGFVDSSRHLRLQTVHLANEVLDYLDRKGEHYVLRCITVRP